MDVELSHSAQKELDRLNEPLYGRIKRALKKLELEPPQGDIKAMAGADKDHYRLRVGDTRVLYNVQECRIFVTNIDSRGQIYKGKGAAE